MKLTIGLPPSKTRRQSTGSWFRETQTGRVVGGCVAVVSIVALIAIGRFSADWLSSPPPEPPPAGVVVDPAFSPALGDTSTVLSLQKGTPTDPPSHICTAVLVAPKKAVTAAHCVLPLPESVEKRQAAVVPKSCPIKDGTAPPTWGTTPPQGSSVVPDDKPTGETDPATFTVRGDSKRWWTGGEVATVTGVRSAEVSWDMTGPGRGPLNDIAVLDLDRPLSLAPMPIASHRPSEQEWVIAYGWGRQPDRCGNSKQFLEQHPMKVTRCPTGYTKLDLCTRTPHRAGGPCTGVSGGPVVAMVDDKPTLVGIFGSHFGGYCGDAGFISSYTPGYTDLINSPPGQ